MPSEHHDPFPFLPSAFAKLKVAIEESFIKDTALLDINYLEESSGRSAELAAAALPKWDQIVLLENHLNQVLDTAVKGCKDVYAILDAAVREHVTETTASLSLDT
ncbi:hypothetical protein CAPTEDRAFT_195956 [Capitella teleta]|uniref:Uncharacterized protein n=1 Tax=Capitella teleta TaxID=283909 RepID=R7T685_CAPTE|nr:hypothetical protein CAPTEDRAFT_195956 [Capitella teleta]|eukprot:ELT89049.1 hypothetical protein CAPTEDRAFT_195956 [Capitella teleta]